jgi:hypothetical protein
MRHARHPVVALLVMTLAWASLEADAIAQSGIKGWGGRSSTASGASSRFARSRRARCTRWRGGATARSWRGGTTRGPEIYFGLLIDPGLPLIVMTSGVTPAEGAVVLQYPIPNDAALSGAILNWQAWCAHGIFAPFAISSFTNLAAMAIP